MLRRPSLQVGKHVSCTLKFVGVAAKVAIAGFTISPDLVMISWGGRNAVLKSMLQILQGASHQCRLAEILYYGREEFLVAHHTLPSCSYLPGMILDQSLVLL